MDYEAREHRDFVQPGKRLYLTRKGFAEGLHNTQLAYIIIPMLDVSPIYFERSRPLGQNPHASALDYTEDREFSGNIGNASRKEEGVLSIAEPISTVNDEVKTAVRRVRKDQNESSGNTSAGVQHNPLSVSTPTTEFHSDISHTSDYLAKKAKRISRLYFGDSSVSRFEDLAIEPPLLEYLVRHGALSEEDSAHVLSLEGRQRRVVLLESLGLPVLGESLVHPSDSHSLSIATNFALLLNALRHTGHHALASQLDCGRRITPAPVAKSSELPELSKLRRQHNNFSCLRDIR
ncbi:unnamed protein product [Calicophoron daubneyi]|uniref:Uncharacterized protein n=1 Tax=Calicophoron daubneyi TaxID=300641 RepID=A0AAV2T7G0_CALDB